MERVLDRIPSFDPASKMFNIRALLTTDSPRSYTWGCTTNLDQGQEGACVGFGWSHEAAAKPRLWNVTNISAHNLYKKAQTLDEWPGENYEGTSVLAGAKASQQVGYIGEYRWAFSTPDALAAISRHGPGVIGIWWKSGMWRPDLGGYIRYTGTKEGGHCILVRGVSVRRGVVLLHNSWGPGWGGTQWGPGTALMTWDDFSAALQDEGECCIPVVRKKAA